MPTFAQALATNNYGPAKFIVSPNVYEGTHTTFTAAIAAASAGDSIIVRPASYTENFTVTKNLNFYAFQAEEREPNPGVEIIGKVTVSADSITCGFYGIKFTTNSDNSILLSSTNASKIVCQNCYFNATNANSISFTSAGSSNIYITNCSGIFASTFGLYTSSSPGALWISNCKFIDTAGTLANNSTSAGTVFLMNSYFWIPFTTSSTGSIIAYNSAFGPTLTPSVNQIWITTAGSVSSFLYNCELYSGTASVVSAGTGTTIEMYNCVVNSSNTNAVTGAGTIKSNAITYNGSSRLNNVTTKAWAELGDSGTFTPALNFNGGSTNLTYTNRYGNYVRIGNLVWFSLDIELSAKGISTGTANITGLPFTSANTAGGSSSVFIFPISADHLTFSGMVNARLTGGSTTINLDQWASAGARTQLSDTAFANATFLQITGVYTSS